MELRFQKGTIGCLKLVQKKMGLISLPRDLMRLRNKGRKPARNASRYQALCILKLFSRNKFVILSFVKKQSTQSTKCSLKQQKHKALLTTTSDVSYKRYNTVASNSVGVVYTQACGTVKEHFDGGKTVLKVYQCISQFSHLPRKLFPFRCS